MASKNIEFTGRLKLAIKSTGLDKAGFAQKAKMGYTTLMNYLVPKGIGRVPEWDQLVKIAQASGKSIDWLLTGKDPVQLQAGIVSDPRAGYGACADSLDTLPEEIKNACRQVRDIFLSDHSVIKPALLSNLAAFQYSVEKEKSQDEEIEKLNRRLKQLEEWRKAERNTGIDTAASSNTGKPKT